MPILYTLKNEVLEANKELGEVRASDIHMG